MQKNETVLQFNTIHKKSTQKWIKDLNIRLEIIKLLGESMEISLPDIDLGKNFYFYFFFLSDMKSIRNKSEK